MKKSTKIAIAALILVIAATLPVYFYMRQNAGSEDLIQIRGAVFDPINMTQGNLKAFTPVIVQVMLTSSKNTAENGVFNYTGVPLSVLLQQVGIIENASSVYVQAADGYGISIPLADIIDNNQTVLAYERNGEPLLTIAEGGEGPYRLIIGTDEFAQRWIRGVTIIEVR